MQQFKSFQEFYPFYLTQHTSAVSRVLHALGSLGGLTLAICALTAGPWWLLLVAPAYGYACAWIGHFVFEKNLPATFGHPFYSFASDWLMLWQMLTGTLPAQRRAAR